MPPAPAQDEKKFVLIYFLNPEIFILKSNRKKILVNGPRNNMFLTSDVTMDFSVVPKQPFYVLDITFTASWLLEQFGDADTSFKEILDKHINKNPQTILIEPCCVEEYKTLHELEDSMLADNQDVLFIRSRVYSLIVRFFSKVANRKEAGLIQSTVNYEQMVQAEMMMMENIKTPPKIEAIARKVNMSVSSLLRQFKLIFGKSINKYYVEKKMELAKKMILENSLTVKEMAEMLGYNQASPFIECFTKYHGYSPGSLKLISY
jgi:AraC-like DNA-binding protein